MRAGLFAAALAVSASSAYAAAPLVHFDWVRSEGRDPEAGENPARSGHFRNPVLPGFHPDPTVIRVGSWYYLANSSFSYYPGLPLFRSRDLVHWQPIGHAFGGKAFPDFVGQGTARGLFAPTLRHDRGKFYLICTLIDKGGSFVISADRITGPWSAPHWLGGLEGIDPDLFFDGETAWVAYNGPPPGTPRYDGHRAIWLQAFDRTSWQAKGERTLLVDGGVDPKTNPIWTEGPHIVRKGAYYYLFTAEGGTAGEHAETIYRSRAITGPYVPGPANPILTQRDLPPGRDHPVYATGHADVVQASDGRWWAVFLGTRPYRANLSNMGRETFLAPVDWSGEWPRILPPQTPLPWVQRAPLPMAFAAPPNRWTERFTARVLSGEWQSLRAPIPGMRSGHGLTLPAGSADLSSFGVPSFLARRQTHTVESVSLQLRTGSLPAGTAAGLAVYSDEAHHFAFTARRSGKGLALTLHRRKNATDPASGTPIGAASLAALPAILELSARISGPEISFAYRVPGQRGWTLLSAPLDAAFLASEESNQFTGVMIGPYAVTVGD